MQQARSASDGGFGPPLALRACLNRSFFLDSANEAIALLRIVGQTANGLNHSLMRLDFHNSDGAEGTGVFDRRLVRLPVQFQRLSLCQSGVAADANRERSAGIDGLNESLHILRGRIFSSPEAASNAVSPLWRPRQPTDRLSHRLTGLGLQDANGAQVLRLRRRRRVEAEQLQRMALSQAGVAADADRH